MGLQLVHGPGDEARQEDVVGIDGQDIFTIALGNTMIARTTNAPVRLVDTAHLRVSGCKTAGNSEGGIARPVVYHNNFLGFITLCHQGLKGLRQSSFGIVGRHNDGYKGGLLLRHILSNPLVNFRQ